MLLGVEREKKFLDGSAEIMKHEFSSFVSFTLGENLEKLSLRHACLNNFFCQSVKMSELHYFAIHFYWCNDMVWKKKFSSV